MIFACERKKTILTFIGYYLPGYKSGGPVITISNMLNLLSEKYSFKIITRDKDSFENKPFQNVKVNQWNLLLNCSAFYNNLKLSLRRVINDTSFDMYYLNSLFDYHFSIKVILLRKLGFIPRKNVLLAPRGELMTGALSVKKLKKRVYIILSRLFNFYSDVTWHASNNNEADDIKREYGADAKIKIALDIPDFKLERAERGHKKEKNKLKILFISIISPKKNLLYVIDVLNKVQGDFTLDIYGPIKDRKYWQKCLNHIDEKCKDKINYKGPISHDIINTVYPNYDLFFFPTLGESFGHVIFESLAFGCPVLCSDTTPWDNLEKFNAGWNINLDKFQQYVDLIENLILLDDSFYNKYITGCEQYLSFFKSEKNIIRNNLKLFEN